MFLLSLGYWLGAGSLGPDGRVSFGPATPFDLHELSQRLKTVGLQEADSSVLGQEGIFVVESLNDNGQQSITVPSARWCSYFRQEYGVDRALAAKTKSAKWFCDWVLQRLDRRLARLLLGGLRFAHGDQATPGRSADAGAIFTSSVSFRDQIERLAYHAGHTVMIGIHQAKGAECAAHQESSATPTHWQVTYTSEERVARPQLLASSKSADLSAVVLQEPVWCVTVPTKSQLIMFRRVLAVDAETRAVLQASRAIVVGNTGEEMAVKLESVKSRHPQLAYEYRLYRILQNKSGTVPGIPAVKWFGREGDFNVLVMELLGPSLEDMFNVRRTNERHAPTPTHSAAWELEDVAPDSCCAFASPLPAFLSPSLSVSSSAIANSPSRPS